DSQPGSANPTGNGGRTLPSSFPATNLISQKASECSWNTSHLGGPSSSSDLPESLSAPGTLHTWEGGTLPAQAVPRDPSPSWPCPVPSRGSSTPSPWGCGPCLLCQHPQTSQRGAGLFPKYTFP
uniref:Uncharacterized protein n=1 Tax=Ficedula albicollis TaxID=59894 RepID=A0A803VSG8_FICAL